MIDFENHEDSKGFKRAGGQANVIIYTRESGVLNMGGKLFIRFISLFSHIY